MVMDEQMKEEMKARYSAIFEYNKMIEAHKEEIKNLNESIRETFKAIAERMEIDPKDKEGKKAIQKGYKDYLDSIEFPDATEIRNDVYLMLKDDDMLGLEKLRD